MWRHTFGGSREAAARASEWLNTDEKRRASRFIFERDRDRYVVRHGFMRMVIADHLDLPPEKVRLDTRDGGKPWCTNEPSLSFSLASVEDTFVLAMDTSPVGVDIDTIRELARPQSVARRWLTPNERRHLDTVDANPTPQQLIGALSRKEAVLKAAGCGFAISPDRIETGPPTSVSVRVEVPPPHRSHWWVTDLSVAEPLIGALATSKRPTRVIWHQWS